MTTMRSATAGTTPGRVVLDVREDRLLFQIYPRDPDATQVEAHALIAALKSALIAGKTFIPERTGRHGEWVIIETDAPNKPDGCAFQIACEWEGKKR